MEEHAEGALSENTLSSEEFDPNQLEEDNGDVRFQELVPQRLFQEAVVAYGYILTRIQFYAQGYNVCKECSKKYKLTSSVTTLRKHLQTHQVNAPVRNE